MFIEYLSTWYTLTYTPVDSFVMEANLPYQLYLPMVYEHYKPVIGNTGWGWEQGKQVEMYCPTAKIQFISPRFVQGKTSQLQIRTQDGAGTPVFWNGQRIGELSEDETTLTLPSERWRISEPNSLQFQQVEKQALTLHGISLTPVESVTLSP